jgi:hypothetical protein
MVALYVVVTVEGLPSGWPPLHLSVTLSSKIECGGSERCWAQRDGNARVGSCWGYETLISHGRGGCVSRRLGLRYVWKLLR